MVKRQIVWTETAVQQRRLILKYWTERNFSSKYAEKLIGLISDQLQVIAENPKAFKQCEIDGIHLSAMGHFSLYYRHPNSK
jgi:plasmid stabilization system protein ParE